MRTSSWIWIRCRYIHLALMQHPTTTRRRHDVGTIHVRWHLYQLQSSPWLPLHRMVMQELVATIHIHGLGNESLPQFLQQQQQQQNQFRLQMQHTAASNGTISNQEEITLRKVRAPSNSNKQQHHNDCDPHHKGHKWTCKAGCRCVWGSHASTEADTCKCSELAYILIISRAQLPSSSSKVQGPSPRWSSHLCRRQWKEVKRKTLTKLGERRVDPRVVDIWESSCYLLLNLN